MTTYVHGKNAALIHGVMDLSPWTREAKAMAKLTPADTSHFQSNSKTFIMGQNDGSFSFGGMYDGGKVVQQGYMGVNEYLAGVVANETAGGGSYPVVLAPQGIGPGLVAVGGLAKQTSYEIDNPVADLETITGDIILNGGFVSGEFLNGVTPITAGTTYASVDDTLASTQGAFMTLHVFSNVNSGNVTYKVQHSADNTTWADLFSFTTVPATTVSAQSGTVTGTVNRYVRLVATLAGTGAVSAAATLSRY